MEAFSAAAPGRPAVHYEDADLLVVEKPAGLLAVPGRGPEGADCLSTRAQRFWCDTLIVHRLDMATSGLMLLARSPEMQRALGAAFAERRVEKRYVAVVHGEPMADPSTEARTDTHTGEDVGAGIDAALSRASGWNEIDLPIAADWPRRPLRIIDAELGKPSITRWRLYDDARVGDTGEPEECSPIAPMARMGPSASRIHPGARLLLAPVTGRTHQLRVHLSAIGHPILGDALYAPPEVAAAAPRLLLHASSLGLLHPRTGTALRFASEPPF